MLASHPPLISVLLPVYNAGGHLAEALSSLSSQTLGDFEVIMVDDGSTDRSARVLEQVAAGDPRFRLMRHAHQGVTAALNSGLAAAAGRYIARMDADDVCEPYRFERQATLLEDRPEVAAVGSALVLIDEDGWTICRNAYPAEHEAIVERLLSGRGALSHPAAMIRAEALRRVGGYDTSYATAQDFDLWLRLSNEGRLANLDEPLLRYRLHANRVGARRRGEQQAAVARALSAHAARTGQTIPPPRLSRPITAIGQQARWALWAWHDGQTATARKHAAAVLRRQPWRWRLWPILLHTDHTRGQSDAPAC